MSHSVRWIVTRGFLLVSIFLCGFAWAAVAMPVLKWQHSGCYAELRGLSVADLDEDGTLEIVVNAASYGRINTWVYEHDGTLRTGWPQFDSEMGSAYGVFNDNTAIAAEILKVVRYDG